MIKLQSIIISFTVLLLSIATLSAQSQVTVEGIITDAENGEPIIGATIILEGTTSGVVSSYDGHYRFGGLTPASVLTISYMGYEDQSVTVGSRKILDVQLEHSSEALEAVIVFGENKRDVRTVTGSVGVIDTKVFSAGSPAGSFDQLLQGQVAGLAVTPSGEPGEKSSIRIRGNNSLGIRSKDDVDILTADSANEPLYIMNGYPISSDVFSTINPDDIVDVRILKDGLSTVEYGTRGANGVVEIKTKRGISGQTQYNVRYQHTVKPISDLGGIDLMGTEEKLLLESQLSIVNGLGYLYTPQMGDSPEEIAIKNKRYNALLGTSTNWLNELSRVAQVEDLQLSFSGGNNDTRYYISGNYYFEEGSYDRSWAERFSTRFNIDHNINDDLTLSFDTSVGRSKRSSSHTSPASLIYTLQPYETLETTDFIARNPLTNSSHYFENPLDELNNRYSEYTSWRIDLNTRLNWYLAQGLNFNAAYGLGYNDGENNSVTLANATTAAAGLTKGLGSFSKSASKSLAHRLNLSLNYSRHFGYHSLSSSAGAEYINTQSWGFGFNSVGLSDKVDPEIGVNPDGSISTSKYRDVLLGLYAQVNYSYDSRYTLSGSYRYDGSSILPIGEQFVPAWGMGAAWDIKNEEWFRSISTFSQFKLRASYGVNYNSGGIRQTLGMPFYDFTNSNTYMGDRVISLVELWNPDLKFERAKQWSLALDFGAFDHRLYGTAEVYLKNTDNLLATVDVPSSNGYTSLLRNIGELQNKGIELQISAVPIRNDNFRWTTTLNYAYNVNKITALYLQDEMKVGSEGYYKVGEPLNSAYVRHWAGVNPSTGAAMYYDETGALVESGVAPQMSGFGTYDHPVTGGWTNIFNYGSFELSGLVTYAWGGVAYNQLKTQMIVNVKNGEVPYAGFLDQVWINTGDEASLPNPKLFTDTTANSLFLEDASYIRLKNVILRYNLSDQIHMRGFSSFKITLQGNNLLTLTRYSGIDPEITGVGLPLARSFTIGVDATF